MPTLSIRYIKLIRKHKFAIFILYLLAGSLQGKVWLIMILDITWELWGSVEVTSLYLFLEVFIQAIAFNEECPKEKERDMESCWYWRMKGLLWGFLRTTVFQEHNDLLIYNIVSSSFLFKMNECHSTLKNSKVNILNLLHEALANLLHSLSRISLWHHPCKMCKPLV